MELTGLQQHAPHAVADRAFLIDRFYVKDGVCPTEKIQWVKRDVPELGNGHRYYVEAPEEWSERSVNIAAVHYLAPQDNDSIRSLILRVAKTIHDWAVEDGTFDNPEVSRDFQYELMYILLHRLASFNSPVYYNIGISENPQCSACFINSVEDSMDSITDLAKREARIFQAGSGAGVNWGRLRSSHEPVKDQGNSSGPVPFMIAHDSLASKIKSGGRKRRAARIDILDMDHPDILNFIKDKANTEKIARILAKQGWSTDMNDPQSTCNILPHQSTNLSVRIPDAFMEAALNDGTWDLHYRNREGVQNTVSARELLHEMAQACWECGDPGVQYHDTINKWSLLQNIHELRATNPCQPDSAPVLTPEGIRSFADIQIGSTIWSGQEWTEVTHKRCTGVKKVYRYHTRGGIFTGTKNHRILSHGDKIEVGAADSIDLSVGPPAGFLDDLDIQDVIDGLMLGDGYPVYANDGANIYPVLCVGDEDQCYFESEVAPLINPQPYDKKKHRVEATTLTPEEMPATYERKVPDRFYRGTETKVRGFLRGLYTANGSICGNRVTLKATSFAVVEAVQQMLSGLGIRSYYTVNRPKDVEFENGVYTCKQSYDLNISVDREQFRYQIGFIHPEKTVRLDAACATPKGSKPPKTTYEIVDVEYLGEMPVWSITVEASTHTYWTGGLHVANCGEFVGRDNTSCNLASINVLPPLRDPLTFEELRHITRVLITAQDTIVHHAGYPHPDITNNTNEDRDLGLGWANLGALCMYHGYPYDSDEARNLVSNICSWTTANAFETSLDLARKHGPFHRAEECREGITKVFYQHAAAIQKVDESGVASQLWGTLITRVENGELPRNATVTLCAPTGTVALLMDCDTTGCEPAIALKATKKLSYGGEMKLVIRAIEPALYKLGYALPAVNKILAQIETEGHVEGLVAEKHLPVFDTAFTSGPSKRSISYMGHLKMLEAMQPHLSMAMSKTINLPYEATVEEVERCFVDAWKMGIKNVALYRDGCKAAQAVYADRKKEAPLTWGERRKMPLTRQSLTRKIDIGGTEVYATVGLYEDGTPGELFFIANCGSTIDGLLDSVAIAVSHALQYGAPLEQLVEKYQGAKFAPDGWASIGDQTRHFKSILDYTFTWIAHEFLKPEASPLEAAIREVIEVDDRTEPKLDANKGELCHRCGNFMVPTGGRSCYLCHSCGSSSGGCG